MDLRNTSKLVLKLSAKIVFWLACAGLMIFLCTKAFSFGYLIFSNEAVAQQGNGVEITVRIPEGASDAEVADILFDGELIKDKYAFMIQSKLFEADFQAGEYKISTEKGPEDIIEILSDSGEDAT